ncbi:MAG: cytochrome c3 family protein [Hyphomicrobiaceae bacterium]
MLLQRIIFATLLAVVGVHLGSADVRAADPPHSSALPQSRVAATPVPVLPKGKGDKCVAPTDWMRRNHMNVLGHQRDATVHEGDRSGQFSLKGCVACHAVQGANGRAVTVADPKHFCRSCHDYAAVSVDCFECHNSRPPEPAKAADLPGSRADVAALARYIKGLTP